MGSKPSREQYLSEMEYINELPMDTDTELNPFRNKDNSLIESLRVFTAYILISLPKYLYYIYKFRKHLIRLMKMKNTFNGERLILLGGGESLDELTQEKVDKLKDNGYHFMTLNHYIKYINLSLTSNHIVLSDPNSIKRVIEDSVDSMSENTKIYIPCSKNINKLLKNNSNLLSKCNPRNLHFFIDNEIRINRMPISPVLPRNYTSMTAYKALSLALHLGYSKIYILGIDNTYLRDTYVNQNNDILAYVSRSKTSSVKEYTYKAMKTSFNSISEWILDIHRLFSDLNLFYDKRNPNRIINLDPYSLVDSFPKMKVESLLEDKNK